MSEGDEEIKDDDNSFLKDYKKCKQEWKSLPKLDKIMAWLGFRNEYVLYLSAKKIYDEAVEKDPSLKDPDEIEKKSKDDFDDWIKEFVANTNKPENENGDKLNQEDATTVRSPYKSGNPPVPPKIANNTTDIDENQSLLKDAD